MKRALGLLCVVSLFSGCTQWKKLTNAEPDKKEVMNVQGVWLGHVQINSQPVVAYFILIQKGDQITWGYTPDDQPIFTINYGQYGHVAVSGSVSDDMVNMVGQYGAGVCPNTWKFLAQVNGGLMTVAIDYDGNNVPGTYCYPDPIHETITLSR